MPARPAAAAPGAPRWTASAALAVSLLALSLLAGACDTPPQDARVVRVGAGSTAEQQLLAALTAEGLARAEVEAEVEVALELGGTRAVREASATGTIDVHWDYTGAAWTLGLGMNAPPVDPQESFEAVAAEDLDEGFRWLGPSGADASLALFVDGSVLPEGEAPTISWLAGQLGQQDGALCADGQFLEAPGGWAYLADTYAIATDLVTTRAVGEEEAVEAVASGSCLAGLATATSGSARAAGLVALRDDQQVFPSLVVAPVVRVDGDADDDDVVAVLDALAASLDTARLADLNARLAAGDPVDEVVGRHLDGVDLG